MKPIFHIPDANHGAGIFCLQRNLKKGPVLYVDMPYMEHLGLHVSYSHLIHGVFSILRSYGTDWEKQIIYSNLTTIAQCSIYPLVN